MHSGKRLAGNGITLIFDSRLHGNDNNSRFAFIISTKVDKRATVRNRIRRLLRESIGHVLPTLTHSIDGVCIGSRGLINLTQIEAQKRIVEILQRV